MTPESDIWEPYNESYAYNKAAMTNDKVEMLPLMYESKELVTNDDYPNIDSVMVMYDAANRHNREAIIANIAV